VYEPLFLYQSQGLEVYKVLPAQQQQASQPAQRPAGF
jgi:hypothetical protein